MGDRATVRGAALVLVAAWLAGCSDSSAGASASPSVGASAAQGPSASLGVNVPADVATPIIADAARRAAVDVTAVTVVAASTQTWPNGALGCPSPGVLYTQAVVSGWQVVVAAGGKEYDYRSSGPGRFKLCTSGPPGSGGPGGGSGAPG